MSPTETLTTIRRRFAAKVGRMTKEQALATLDAIRAEHPGPGASIFSATIRGLTGGYNSQSLNMQVIRKLGVRAGIIRNHN